MSADFWAGYFSGAASIVIGNPLDLIKVRLQASNHNAVASPRTWQSFKTLAAGLPAPILTYGALNALLFTTYNRSLTLFKDEHLGISGNSAQPQTYSYPLWNHFVAGAAAGFATFFISAPTEYIKCRAQVMTDPIQSDAQRRVESQSSFKIAVQTLRERGIRGLFLGGTVTSVRDAIGYGFWFVTYEGSKNLWDDHILPRQQHQASDQASINPHEALKILLCGGLAGVATWTSVYPLDVIKTKVQTQPLPMVRSRTAQTPLLDPDSTAMMRSRGALQMAKEAYTQEGLLIFWRGLGVCCLRAFVVNAVQWSAYEWTMRWLL